jgi:hypothetical protein
VIDFIKFTYADSWRCLSINQIAVWLAGVAMTVHKKLVSGITFAIRPFSSGHKDFHQVTFAVGSSKEQFRSVNLPDAKRAF